MAYIAELFNARVNGKNGKPVDLKAHCAGKTVGIYFSAQWCPPCKTFTPNLIDFYKKYSKSKNFEIIFVSSDQDETAFKDYYKEMPWLALAYGERQKKKDLCEKFNVDGIPTLILLNAKTGEVYNSDAVSKIEEDNAEQFPWKNK